MNEKALFGAGCFWSVEESFRLMKGVLSTRAGYAGGHLQNPSYEDVCSGNSGHTEVVEVTFDSKEIHFKDLIDKFFSIHDSTGNHGKSQYQSVIIYFSPEQETAALAKLSDLKSSARPPSTILIPFTFFQPAEERHQKYALKRKQLGHGSVTQL
ncbi:MAG TPA: peptide-methionine (S)-S-oxide reductase MsrA [Bacteriovoracaceae bacterium]|nr:peptide-methionine (S)-S-oxide reductase MsrA [Bacteriovoracaceae bacterium]